MSALPLRVFSALKTAAERRSHEPLGVVPAVRRFLDVLHVLWKNPLPASLHRSGGTSDALESQMSGKPGNDWKSYKGHDKREMLERRGHCLLPVLVPSRSQPKLNLFDLEAVSALGRKPNPNAHGGTVAQMSLCAALASSPDPRFWMEDLMEVDPELHSRFRAFSVPRRLARPDALPLVRPVQEHGVAVVDDRAEVTSVASGVILLT